MKSIRSIAMCALLMLSCSGCVWLGLGFLGGWAFNRYGVTAPAPTPTPIVLPPVSGYDPQTSTVVRL